MSKDEDINQPDKSEDETDNTGPAQPSQHKLHVLGDTPHEYDTDSVLEFIDNVFVDLPVDAHRLVYASSSNIPSSPMSGIKYLEKTLNRTTKPKAFYFAMSSVYPDAKGLLSHKTENFAAMHGVIFDDIGTKIDVSKIPAGLEPTYIIESSAGNYQYGYLFDKPVTDVNHALAITNTIAAAGLTDAGGKVPIKLVRLPVGINGKPNAEKQTFGVNLHKWNGTVYTPETLLDRIAHDDGTGVVTWERISRDNYDPLVKKHNTKYLPLMPQGQSTDGIIDDVLEWLYSNDDVIANSGDGWVDIVCPWHHEHTDGNPTAGYNPLGQGEDPFSRGFHCFHEHCKDKDTKEFLVHVINSSDIEVLSYRVNAWLGAGDYAYDKTTGDILKLVFPPVIHNFGALKRSYGPTPAVTGAGKNIALNPVDAWMKSPYRITIEGQSSSAGEPLIFDDPRGKWLNTCIMPDWGTGAFDQAHVDKFLAYCNYIIPDVDECTFWLDWLTHKMRDPKFRGTGIVMVTPTFGVGRSTLASMVARLLGEANTARVDFTDLVESKFNHWEDKVLVTIDEARDTSSANTGLHKAYEVLKQRVDTTVVQTMVNPKYGAMYTAMNCSSYLILSNHINAIAIPKSDRRLTILSNAQVPLTPQEFTDLNTWLDQGEWMPHVFRYLVQRTATYDCLTPLVTGAKTAMVDSTQSKGAEIAKLIEAYCTDNDIHFAAVPDMSWVLTEALVRSGSTTDYNDKYFGQCLNDISRVFSKHRITANQKAQKVRMLNWAVVGGVITGYEEGMWAFKGPDMLVSTKQSIVAHCKKFDVQTVLDHVLAELA